MSPSNCSASTWCADTTTAPPSGGLSKPKPTSARKIWPVTHPKVGRRARKSCSGRPGRAYVYFIYGFYNMLNLVTEAKDYPAAVLIRAVEPVDGIELMKERRKNTVLRNLASGPGKLCQAFAVDRSLNGAI